METKFLRTSLIATVCFFSVSVGITDAYGMDKDEQIIRYEHQLNTCKKIVVNEYEPRRKDMQCNQIRHRKEYKCEDCQLTIKLLENLKKK
jgi:hypothetical protein